MKRISHAVQRKGLASGETKLPRPARLFICSEHVK